MKHTPVHTSSSRDGGEMRRLTEILRRVAGPLLIFLAVLTALLLLSWLLLLPRLTQVEIGGSVRNVSSLKQYRAELREQVRALAERRHDFLLPTDHPLYRELRALKLTLPRFHAMRQHIRDAARSTVPDMPNAVRIDRIVLHAAERSLAVHGRVHRVGPRSMTVLAQFLEAVRALPFAQTVESSRFIRRQTDDGRFYSPFTLSIHFS